MRIPRAARIPMAIGVILFLLVGWQYIVYFFNYGYGTGTRTGIIRKISVKGPPYCKYMAGELALQGGNMGLQTDIFVFSVDDHSDGNPLVQQLQEAQRAGTRVTLAYREDHHLWWRCTPDEYLHFVTKVEKDK